MHSVMNRCVLMAYLFTSAAAAEACGSTAHHDVGGTGANASDTAGLVEITNVACNCGKQADGSTDQECAATKYCFLGSADNKGVCLAAAAGTKACAAYDTESTAECVCAADRACFASTRCLKNADGSKGVCSAHADGDPTACTVTNGSAGTEENCRCGAVGCIGAANAFWCNVDTCEDAASPNIKTYPACPAEDGSEASVTKCTCGKDKICSSSAEFCISVNGVGNCAKAQCTDTSGKTLVDGTVAANQCQCGNNAVVDGADEACVKERNGNGTIVTEARAECPGADVGTTLATPAGCSCGTMNCLTTEYCHKTRPAGTECGAKYPACDPTDGSAVNSADPATTCLCGSDEVVVTSDKICNHKADGKGEALATPKCNVTNGSGVHGADPATACSCGADNVQVASDKWCNIKADGNGELLTAAATGCADQFSLTAGTVADCPCGKTAKCATGKFCLGTGNGTCGDSAVNTACTKTDGSEKVDSATCFCGTKACPNDTDFCVTGGSGDSAEYACIAGAIGDAFVANLAAEKKKGEESVTKANKDNCASGDFCECDDDTQAGSAACISQFVTTMGYALNQV